MTDKERADALSAELETLKATMSTSANAAVTADRERRSAIMALPEAAGREALAEHLFAKGDSVDDAKATLAVSAKVTAAGDPPRTDAQEHEQQRLNGAGLGNKPSAKGGPATMRVDLVADMKRRHGVK